MPEFCREYPSKDEAVNYAKGRAQELATTGEPTAVVLLVRGTETVLWESARAQDKEPET